MCEQQSRQSDEAARWLNREGCDKASLAGLELARSCACRLRDGEARQLTDNASARGRSASGHTDCDEFAVVAICRNVRSRIAVSQVVVSDNLGWNMTQTTHPYRQSEPLGQPWPICQCKCTGTRQRRRGPGQPPTSPPDTAPRHPGRSCPF